VVKKTKSLGRLNNVEGKRVLRGKTGTYSIKSALQNGADRRSVGDGGGKRVSVTCFEKGRVFRYLEGEF